MSNTEQLTRTEPNLSGNRGYAYAAGAEGLGLAVIHGARPDPGTNEVLVRVQAASLNYRDLLVARAKPAGLVPLSDGAGMIEAIGPGVKRLAPGDRVAAGFFRNWTDGPFQADFHASARGGGAVGGMLTRYVVANETELVKLPDAISAEQAATLPCAGVTAWQALVERGGLKAGETVLVQGTGGVAIFGLQIATALGARVIVTSSSDEKLERARKLGAWQTINYASHPDWDEQAVAITDGRGVDHVLETGGQQTFERSLKAVAAGGRIAQIGGLTGFGPQVNTIRLQLINATIDGINVGPATTLAKLAAFVAERAITPTINRVYDFDDAPAAFDDLANGRTFGKLVIRL